MIVSFCRTWVPVSCRPDIWQRYFRELPFIKKLFEESIFDIYDVFKIQIINVSLSLQTEHPEPESTPDTGLVNYLQMSTRRHFITRKVTRREHPTSNREAAFLGENIAASQVKQTVLSNNTENTWERNWMQISSLIAFVAITIMAKSCRVILWYDWRARNIAYSILDT